MPTCLLPLLDPCPIPGSYTLHVPDSPRLLISPRPLPLPGSCLLSDACPSQVSVELSPSTPKLMPPPRLLLPFQDHVPSQTPLPSIVPARAILIPITGPRSCRAVPQAPEPSLSPPLSVSCCPFHAHVLHSQAPSCIPLIC